MEASSSLFYWTLPNQGPGHTHSHSAQHLPGLNAGGEEQWVEYLQAKQELQPQSPLGGFLLGSEPQSLPTWEILWEA